MFAAYIAPASGLLSDAYHIFFCNKLVKGCIPVYQDHIFKCKRVSAIGAQQLALDAHAIKSIFLSIPKMRAAGSITASSDSFPPPCFIFSLVLPPTARFRFPLPVIIIFFNYFFANLPRYSDFGAAAAGVHSNG
jgi:hypothetical protein